MNKKDNVLKKWWFTLIFIPVIMGLGIIVHTFAKFGGWSQLNSSLLQWLTVFIVAMVIQTYFVFKNKVKYKAEHFTFIGFSILVTIFVGFILSAFVFKDSDNDKPKWLNTLYSSLISFVVMFIFKTIMWQALHIKSTSSLNKDERLKQLEQENETMKQELVQLKGEEASEETTKKKWWKIK